MKKLVRVLVVAISLVAFAMGATAFAADEFYVVKEAAGKMAVVDKKPDDAKSVVKGPFKTKAEAEAALKAASKPKPPTVGC
ncbi:MAG: hypothetical protein AB7V04_05175 [Desulfomonilaceae bacterium]|nr:hypothetical protein [Syntrophaceae bacterium]